MSVVMMASIRGRVSILRRLCGRNKTRVEYHTRGSFLGRKALIFTMYVTCTCPRTRYTISPSLIVLRISLGPTYRPHIPSPQAEQFVFLHTYFAAGLSHSLCSGRYQARYSQVWTRPSCHGGEPASLACMTRGWDVGLVMHAWRCAC